MAQETMHPILFSTPMVQAILAGRKSQTRRIVRPQPNYIESSGRWVWPIPKSKVHPGCCTEVCSASREWYEYLAPDQFPYQIGDVLWCRESWNKISIPDGTTARKLIAVYKADRDSKYLDGIKWKPSIHMPKSACRLFLKITDVRVERLKDISEEDAKAEGVEPCTDGTLTWYKTYQHGDFRLIPAKMSFQSLWQSINGIDSWNANPWVWVISFEKTTPALINTPEQG